MPGRYTHPETQGLKTLLEHDPELVAAAKVRVKTLLLLLCDLVNLELGDATRPHLGTPQQQHLRERARALFLSLGLGAAIGDTGDAVPAPVPEPLALEVQQFLQELHVPEPLIRQVIARIEDPIVPEPKEQIPEECFDDDDDQKGDWYELPYDDEKDEEPR